MAFLRRDMSIDELALVQGILANPDDDAPRLVHAGWLQENGQEAHGDMIDAMIMRRRRQTNHPRWKTLGARAMLLQKKMMGTSGMRILPRDRRLRGVKITPTDGMPGGVTVGRDAVIDQALGALLRDVPVPTLTLEDRTDLGALVSVIGPDPVFRPHEFWLYRPGTDIVGGAGAAIQVLATASYFANLGSVNIYRYALGPAGFAALAAASYLTRLHRLWLERTDANANGIRVLLRRRFAPGLRVLVLAGGSIGDDGVAALAEADLAATLEALHLDDAGIGSTGAEILASMPALANVRWLSLTGNPIGPVGVQHLIRSKILPTHLRLSLDANLHTEFEVPLRDRFRFVCPMN